MTTPNEASDPTGRRLGSYTTARVRAGRVERLERHVRRLRRDAGRLGLPLPDRQAVEDAFVSTARATFPHEDGVVRVEWSTAPGEAPRLTTSTRPLDPTPDAWRAITSSGKHPGPGDRAGTKHVAVEAWDRARAERLAAGVEEALLFDAEGRLVEGSRSSLIVVLVGDRIVTPALALGGVEGLGLECVREGPWRIQEAEIRAETLREARALLAVNAVRGVVPITRLDGRPIGDADAAALWARRLGAGFGVARTGSRPGASDA